MSHDAALARLLAHYQAMPPVAAMGLRIAGYDGERLRLAAPLALHLNDKGCAFGGSLGSLLTLAAWGVLHLRLEDAGIDADVFVADSTLRFLAPLYDDLQAEAHLSDAGDWEVLLSTLRARGRARIDLSAEVPLPDGRIATTLRARYVAILRRSSGPAGIGPGCGTAAPAC